MGEVHQFGWCGSWQRVINVISILWGVSSNYFPSIYYLLLSNSCQSNQKYLLMEREGIKFLVATDIHLGHKEKHPVRSNDSFDAFEEVLQQAKQQDVDFLLLGGDLFDQVNPSQQCLFRCLNSLKTHIFGSRTIPLTVTLNGEPYETNFTNKNTNISLPIFTIHGNHDYPSNQFGKISVCDLLQASSYVNYFGKHPQLKNIQIRPLLINKEGTSTTIALYGLGYIKDPIINDLFQSKEAVFELPKCGLQNCITIFVLHQNRYKKGFRSGAPLSNSFSPKNIPDWINLTIWGHEHEAIYKVEREFDRPVYQPGSTVLTSYIEAESFKKQCLLIQAEGRQFKLSSIILEHSYRPMFVMSWDIEKLKQEFGQNFQLFDFLDYNVEQILKRSKESHPFKRPIIRFKVEYESQQALVRMPQLQKKYSDLIANGDKLIQFVKKKIIKLQNISDSEMLDNIKFKRIVAPNVGFVEQAQNIFKKSLEQVEFGHFDKDFMFDSMMAAIKQPNSLNPLIKKAFGDSEDKNNRQSKQQIKQRIRNKELQFKKAMKYQSDRKYLLTHEKLPEEYEGHEEKYEYLEQSAMDDHRFNTYCRLLEEEANPRQNNGNSKMSGKNGQNKVQKSSQNGMKTINMGPRPSHMDVGLSEREDSEDCCEKAMRQKVDEDSNKRNFHDAKKKIDQKGRQGLKRNDDLNSKKSRIILAPTARAIPKNVKPQKGVRFSQDLF